MDDLSDGEKVLIDKLARTFVKILVGVVVLAVGFSLVGIKNIKSNEVGVKIEKLGRNIDQKPIMVGYEFYFKPATDVVIYKVGARSYPEDVMGNENGKEYTMDLKTNDGQNMQLDLTIIYSLRPADVPSLHQEIGPNYEDQILLPQIRSEARLAIGKYSSEEIYQGKVRDDIQQGIKERLAIALKKYPAIEVQDALIRSFEFSPAFENAIEQKKLAAQKVEINKNEALAQKEESLRMQAEAEGRKMQLLQDAEGKTQAVRMAADADRYRLEQEAAGMLAKYKAEAEGRKLQAEALGGGENVVALEFARAIPPHFQIWGIPVGQNTTSIMDMGIFKDMFRNRSQP